MDELSWVDHLEDRVTFGAGYIAWLALLVLVFFAFVFGLIRFQDINAPYGPLSSVLYLSITATALTVAYAILRQIGSWTFSRTLHRRTCIFSTIAVYFGVTLTAVLVGYLIINPRVSAVGELGPPDILVGTTVASIYTTILCATTLYQDFAELLGKPNERLRCMTNWLQALNQAKEVDGFGHAKTEAYNHFVKQSQKLHEELKNAKTNEGEQFQEVFEEWFLDFQGRSSTISREAILTGETENDCLKRKHQTLTWIRQQVEDIRGDEDWKNTTQ